MLRGLLAFALATCVIGAPVASDLCQAVCAGRAADAAIHPAGAGAHHSCHAEAPSQGPSVVAVHLCGHENELPGVDRPERGMATALAIIPAVAIVVPPIHHVAPEGIAAVQASPPPLLALSSQLRV
jgi:hypothetical protein